VLATEDHTVLPAIHTQTMHAFIRQPQSVTAVRGWTFYWFSWLCVP